IARWLSQRRKGRPYRAAGRQPASTLGKVTVMHATSSREPSDRPAATPGAIDYGAERAARRAERAERRAAPGDGPSVMIPSRRARLPLEAPLMRAVATAGIVAIAVVVAAIMAS